MTTAYQWIFDNASSISINKRATVAQTVTRDGTVRRASRGAKIWRFTVEPAPSLWETARPYITAIEHLDRIQSAQVQINNPGYNSWLTGYQGDLSSTSGVTASWDTGNEINLNYPGGHGLINGQRALVQGDFIQLGQDRSVYEVVEDVPYPSTVVKVNRPIMELPGTDSIKIGTDVTWQVVCTKFPEWTISDINVVTWRGNFEFYEDLA